MLIYWMGCQCSDSNGFKLTDDNEQENLFREVIYDFNLKYYSFKQIVEKYRLFPYIVENLEKPREISFSEEEYNKTCLGLLNNNSQFFNFHKRFFPEFDQLFEDYYQVKKPDFVFLIFCFPFLTDANNPEIICQLFRYVDLELTYNNFSIFLEIYLGFYLSNLTKVINYVIQDYSKRVLIGNKLIDKEFKKQCNDIEVIFCKVSNLIDFKSCILRKLSEVMEINSQDELIKNGLKVTKLHLRKLLDSFYFVFNFSELRNYFYYRYINKN